MSEPFEVPSPHEHHVEHAHGRGDRFAGKIAVMTAIMATLGALLSYQAGSTESEAAMDKNNAAIKKTEASNQWNYYQAKSSRENLADLASHMPGLDAEHYRSATATTRMPRGSRPRPWKPRRGPGTNSQNSYCTLTTAGPRR